MLCALSGESPQNPVVSSKSGNVFERRLIEAYISENGKDPVTGEELTVDDLIEVKTARVVRPRPPTLTSIPSLLSVFQNEWDALALESYNLRQQLGQTRQELATALYQQDAAVRVIARLSKERDEAREALSKVTVGAGSASNGDRMQVDSAGLPEELSEKVDATQEKLSKSRRKRPVPVGWATAEQVESFTTTTQSEPSFPGATSISTNPTGELAIVGADGQAGVFSITDNSVLHTVPVAGAKVTDVVWYGEHSVISTSAGAVMVLDSKEEVATFKSHAGAANALALHPSGDILASVGVDKSFVFYDLANLKAVTQVFTDSELTAAAFHPDGHIFAAGGADGQVKMYHTKSCEFAASFDCGGPVQALSFSENGIWFATATRGSTSITIFDLRKEGKAAEVKVMETGSKVESIAWDFTGQFLASAGSWGITVQQYTKSSKSWSEPLRSAVPATAVSWGSLGQSLVSVSAEGVVTVLGSK